MKIKDYDRPFDFFVDPRSKICIRSSYAEGVCNYGGNSAQVIHECVLYIEDNGSCLQH